ncbi:Myosin light chain 5 [Collichthys lucidus]|uniref:Myosin light chain 5 n=1 Tax=Collichthys lucidus TaxID=240159 RepID=A0A4U5VC09_COLLU|nr:Myosin light chain 5 [Collichthys lucidus]
MVRSGAARSSDLRQQLFRPPENSTFTKRVAHVRGSLPGRGSCSGPALSPWTVLFIRPSSHVRQLLYLKPETQQTDHGETEQQQDTMASRKTKKKEGGAKRAQRASSNVFSMFEQTQIQEFKEAFTLIDQNRDGFIDKEDLKDTYASLGKLNVKDNELEDMLKEATGTDPEDTILNAFKLFDPDAKGFVHKDELQKVLMTQADKFTAEEVKQMFQSSNIDAAGNLDYKSLCYIITHGEEQEE